MAIYYQGSFVLTGRVNRLPDQVAAIASFMAIINYVKHIYLSNENITYQ